jgi:ribosomal protein S18 acetylase RimI-like enzyme
MYDIIIKTGKDNMQLEAVKALLTQTYWANQLPMEKIIKSMENSLCFGAFIIESDIEKQIGFARAVSDYTTVFYICDVIVDEKYRGTGAGKKLVESICTYKDFSGLKGLLITKDAQDFYRKFGFEVNPTNFMLKFN